MKTDIRQPETPPDESLDDPRLTQARQFFTIRGI